MDIVPLAGMLLSLLIILIIAGSILMFPLVRRLGRLLDLRIDERRSGAIGPDDVTSLRATVEGLQEEVRRLAERQGFTERLLEAPRSGAHPERTQSSGPVEAGEQRSGAASGGGGT